MLISRSLTQTRLRRPGPRTVAAVAAACVAAASGCGGSVGDAETEPVNVLLVSIDTVRADHLSVYGYERATTPALEALAQQGVRFDAAYAPTATTAPSHASLFTSLYPPTHRVIKNGRVLAEEHETLAEVLARWGYQCGAVVSSYVLHHKFNFDQGFDSWDDDFRAANAPVGVTTWEGVEVEGKFYGRADDTTQRAQAWLEARAVDQPFFLFVHYYDPHDPYDPPPGWAQRFEKDLAVASSSGLDLLIAGYDAEIAYTDQEIGRLLEVLDTQGLAEETLVVVTGDHGEGLWDHNHLNHGAQIYEEAVRIPLILRWPGRIAPGGSISTPVQLTDVAPTILELAGPGAMGSPPLDELLREKGGAPRGHSLVPELSGRGESGPIYLYRRHYEGEMIGPTWTEGEKFGLREGRWKYIRGDSRESEELYDLEKDPGEHNDLREAFPDVARRLSQQLNEWHRSVVRGDPAMEPLSAEDRAKLKALGYVD